MIIVTKKSFPLVLILSGFIAILSTYANDNDITLMNPKKNWISLFQKFIKVGHVDTFVETGTYLGDTTAKAATCFRSVHSIELSDELIKKAVARFQNTTNITLHHGDSAEIFPRLLPELAKKQDAVLFWLDGHYVDKETALGNDYTPIEKELYSITNTKLNNPIILIDDIRLFGTMLNDQRLPLAGRLEYPLLSNICRLLENNSFAYVILGDILLAYPRTMQLSFSPVLNACTVSRLFDGKNFADEHILAAENAIALAQGEELESLHELYKDFSMPWKGWYNKSPHYNLWYGLILKNRSEHEKAIDQFHEVLNLGYNHWRIYWYLAESLFCTQQYELASSNLHKVLQERPDFQPASELLQKIHNYSKENETRKPAPILKYVIGPWPGGLGVCLHNVLNHLVFCEKQKRTPAIFWGSDSLYYDSRGFNGYKNVWNYYFMPVSTQRYKKGDKIHIFYPDKSEHEKFSYYDTTQEKRYSAYRLINKYIRPNAIVQSKITNFFKKNIYGKRTIGIHIRGTDKIKEEKPVEPLRLVAEALKYADANTQFFVASDEKKLFDEIVTLLHGRTVIAYDCYRSENENQPLHVRLPSRAQLGEDVVIEMILLSKCDMLIHTLSNVSAIPLYFNPNLPHAVLK
jgi:tetratricopeptide (TPR) repeat protein